MSLPPHPDPDILFWILRESFAFTTFLANLRLTCMLENPTKFAKYIKFLNGDLISNLYVIKLQMIILNCKYPQIKNHKFSQISVGSAPYVETTSLINYKLITIVDLDNKATRDFHFTNFQQSNSLTIIKKWGFRKICQFFNRNDFH